MDKPVTVRRYPVLTLAAILVGMGLLIDGLVILNHTPQGLEFILFADVPIFMGLTLDLYLAIKGRKPKVGELASAPKVNQLVVESEESTSDAYPEITPEMFQSSNIGATPVPSEPSSRPPPPKKRTARSESPKPKYVYMKSPERMNSAAFVCSCGHPHRFVCLNCGMTVEKALNKKSTRWVEWQPEMEALS